MESHRVDFDFRAFTLWARLRVVYSVFWGFNFHVFNETTNEHSHFDFHNLPLQMRLRVIFAVLTGHAFSATSITVETRTT